MLQKIRRYNRSVIATWLVSYLSVLLVPIVISMILYSATHSLVEKEINRANELLLTQIEMSIDSKLKGLEQLSLEVALNKNVSSFANVEKPLFDDQYYQLFNIAESLRTYQRANDYIEQIYVMYANSDTVVSTFNHTDSRGLFTLMRPGQETSFEEWRRLFDQKYVYKYSPMKYWNEGTSMSGVMFARSLVLNNPLQPYPILIILINENKLLESIPKYNDSSLLILDKDNHFIAASKDKQELQEHLPSERLLGKKGLVYAEMNQDKAALSYVTSELTGWKYVSVLPAEIFNEKMEYLKAITRLGIALGLLIGIIVTIIFLRKNYMPIQVLLQNMTQRSGFRFDGKSNEYSFLQNALHHTFIEKDEISKLLKLHNNTIRAHFLTRLLKGQLEKKLSLTDSFAAHNVHFVSDRFAVLLFSIDAYGKLQTDEADASFGQETQMLHFVLSNVIEELAGGDATVYSTEVNELTACIVNLKPLPSNEEEDLVLIRMATQTQAFIKEHIHAEMTIAVSGVHNDVYGISQSYQEALETLEHRIVRGNGQVILYKEISMEAAFSGRNYYYPLSVEQQLVYYVKTGNLSKSQALLAEIYEANFKDHPVSVPLAKCLLFNLASTMLKTLDEVSSISKRNFEAHAEDVERLLNCDTVQDMMAHINRVLEQVCEWIQTDKKNQHTYLIDDIRVYIQTHFRDVNLNISMIGESFSLTPSYVSKIFKEHTGESLLDLINHTRLSAAKVLLSEHNLTINEVAWRVGYADVSTFLRIFKKFEGMTPGKYQKI
ncbi:helix-turn-helix domain-containing protein [Paenibacillus sp. CGMCC 1.16610]|uniref:Helix-turn-helix domain-containing protein n=1 Tax=Paenibacillus anseongense TaxID=2682845 RepID=A0ABW9UA98_9BACL|nr:MULTISPECIES: helix-turn-helix domain-containing protein [Paenibacillus]MBA2937263.1 helix-turn-helix domain-containing protein [Paenibacillus sp. CGMCC 1.16610]MVQ36322.1 helix-turn-helix domain-containing protein [Paenibacillus anseongense]